MFVIERDNSIHITRGDIGTIQTSALNNDTGEAYTFKHGNIVRLSVFEKNKCENVVLSKDVIVTAESPTVDIPLTSEDTKIGSLINKPVDYWYEIVLNPLTAPQTLVGYDKKGEKIFRLYPEGNDPQSEIKGVGV